MATSKKQLEDSGNSKSLVELPPGKLEGYIDNMVNQLDASEITITFRDSFINQFNDMDEIIILLKRYFRYLPFNDIREVVLVAEYGDTSRIHFHGIIRGKHKELATLLVWLKKRFGRSTITMIKHPDKYKKYMLKEKPEDFIYYKYN